MTLPSHPDRRFGSSDQSRHLLFFHRHFREELVKMILRQIK